MGLNPAGILELIGPDTIIAAFIVGGLVSAIYLKTRRGPTSLGLLERTRVE